MVRYVANTFAITTEFRVKYPFVLGTDFTGDEYDFPLTEELKKAHTDAQIPLTVHAGERTNGHAVPP